MKMLLFVLVALLALLYPWQACFFGVILLLLCLLGVALVCKSQEGDQP